MTPARDPKQKRVAAAAVTAIVTATIVVAAVAAIVTTTTVAVAVAAIVTTTTVAVTVAVIVTTGLGIAAGLEISAERLSFGVLPDWECRSPDWHSGWTGVL